MTYSCCCDVFQAESEEALAALGAKTESLSTQWDSLLGSRDAQLAEVGGASRTVAFLLVALAIVWGSRRQDILLAHAKLALFIDS
jgi:hypothetical protein